MTPDTGGATRFDTNMSDAEALMWNVEKDPWLSSTFGTVLFTSSPIDVDRFRRKVARAVLDVPRLRERVAPGLGRLSPPRWLPDADFDLAFHVRHVAMPTGWGRRELLDLCCHLLEDPFDRTRPLWQFTVIDGVDAPNGTGGALLVKMHHTVTDGVGAVRLAVSYMDLDADEADADPVDLAAGADPVDLNAVDLNAVDLNAVVAATAPASVEANGGLDPRSLRSLAAATAVTSLRRPLDLARRWAGESLLGLADPGRLPQLHDQVMAGWRAAAAQLDSGDPADRSPLWTIRSRCRRLEVLDLPFGPVKSAARALGGTINDLFVTGAVAGAGAYHRAVGVDVARLTVTFVISTRRDGSGANAFTPAKAVLPAGDLPAADRFAAVSAQLGSERVAVGGAGGLLGAVAGTANLLPTSLTASFARAQARSVDFATSNVKASPLDVYVGGAKVVATYPVGPVAGTAFNLTTMSYCGSLYLGLHLDPKCVTDAALLVTCMRDAYSELLCAGGQQPLGAPRPEKGGSSRRVKSRPAAG